MSNIISPAGSSSTRVACSTSGHEETDKADKPPHVYTHVDLLSRGMIKLYGVWSVAFLATFMACDDHDQVSNPTFPLLASLPPATSWGGHSANWISAIPAYQVYFDFDGLGVSAGLVFSMWPVAGCATFWLGPVISDGLGRRGGMFLCSVIFILGSFLFAFAQNTGMLLAGRFFLGAGVGMMQPAAPPYIVELAPPEGRGKLTGLFNVCWVLGGILATGISIATSSMQSNWAWRLPVTIQLLFPCAMTALVFFLPESPRWLHANGHPERALLVLQKYHGSGHITPLVELEIEQIKESVKVKPKRWNYRAIVGSRSARYRLTLAVMMGAFGQLSGNGLLNFLPGLYKQVGVNSVRKQLVMTLIASIVSLVGSLIGTYYTDRLGRRKMLVWGTLACAIVLSCAMGASSASNTPFSSTATEADAEANGEPASKAAIAFLIMFGAVYGWGYQPLLPIYPSEVLSMEQRSTGMGLMVLSLNLASFLNFFAIPIALKKIGWWTYLPFICWDLTETAAWYFLAVETKNLEELDEIFDSPNPVKASLRASRVPGKLTGNDGSKAETPVLITHDLSPA